VRALGLGFIPRRWPAKELVMTTLRDIVKDRRVYSIDAGRTVLEAARFMMEHNIGACLCCATEYWRESFPSATS